MNHNCGITGYFPSYTLMESMFRRRPQEEPRSGLAASVHEEAGARLLGREEWGRAPPCHPLCLLPTYAQRVLSTNGDVEILGTPHPKSVNPNHPIRFCSRNKTTCWPKVLILVDMQLRPEQQMGLCEGSKDTIHLSPGPKSRTQGEGLGSLGLGESVEAKTAVFANGHK